MECKKGDCCNCVWHLKFKHEIDEILLFEREHSICIIEYKNIKNKTIIGNGFFIKLNEACIPFNKCLITCNHILSEEDIEIEKKIKLQFKNKEMYLYLRENRRIYTDEKLDYTLIEIFDYDVYEIEPYFLPIEIYPEHYDDNYFKNRVVFFYNITKKKKIVIISN